MMTGFMTYPCFMLQNDGKVESNRLRGKEEEDPHLGNEEKEAPINLPISTMAPKVVSVKGEKHSPTHWEKGGAKHFPRLA